MKEGRSQKDLCERTFQFAIQIVNLCRMLSKKSGIGQMVSKQLLRSGTSIGANIEEGQTAQSRADFISKYSISRKEACETHYWLRLLSESQFVSEADISRLLTDCNSDVNHQKSTRYEIRERKRKR